MRREPVTTSRLPFAGRGGGRCRQEAETALRCASFRMHLGDYENHAQGPAAGAGGAAQQAGQQQAAAVRRAGSQLGAPAAQQPGGPPRRHSRQGAAPIYRRPQAGQQVLLPSDVSPPSTGAHRRGQAPPWRPQGSSSSSSSSSRWQAGCLKFCTRRRGARAAICGGYPLIPWSILCPWKPATAALCRLLCAPWCEWMIAECAHGRRLAGCLPGLLLRLAAGRLRQTHGARLCT
jgi:hypothetical protein